MKASTMPKALNGIVALPSPTPTLAALRSSIRPVVTLSLDNLASFQVPSATRDGISALRKASPTTLGIQVPGSRFLALPGSASASQMVVFVPSLKQLHQRAMVPVFAHLKAIVARNQRRKDFLAWHAKFRPVMQQYAKAWWARFSLTLDDKISLRFYCNNNFRAINGALRTGDYSSSPASKRIPAILKALTKRNLQSYQGEVYRGTDLPPHVAAELQPGAIYSDKAFLSTSDRRELAFKRTTTFIIESKTGCSIKKFSRFDEGEILFRPNTFFRIQKVEKGAEKGVDRVVTMVEMV
jgi:NAD:arginine ADP-ribosyltransferase